VWYLQQECWIVDQKENFLILLEHQKEVGSAVEEQRQMPFVKVEVLLPCYPPCGFQH
jgi:hypothetical protein